MQGGLVTGMQGDGFASEPGGIMEVAVGLDRPTPTLVPCWSLNPCLQGTSVGDGLPQP